MKFNKNFIENLAVFICGDDKNIYPIYRSSSKLTSFFQNIGIDVAHNGETRKHWVCSVLDNLTETQLETVIKTLVSQELYVMDLDGLRAAITSMNQLLFTVSKKIEFDGALVKIVENKQTVEDLLNMDKKPADGGSSLINHGNNSPQTIVQGDSNIVNISYNLSSKDEEISQLFRQIVEIAKTVEDNREILFSIEEMQKTIQTPSFKDKYKNFISTIADLIHIFGGLIPLLTKYL